MPATIVEAPNRMKQPAMTVRPWRMLTPAREHHQPDRGDRDDRDGRGDRAQQGSLQPHHRRDDDARAGRVGERAEVDA